MTHEYRSTLKIVFLMVLAHLGIASYASDEEIPVYDYEIVNIFPHDPNAFTQGLFFKNGFLYESTGRYGQSSLRKVHLETGRIVRFQALPNRYFGEGVTSWADKIIGLSWRAGVGFVWGFESFTQQNTFRYRGEGWGLTSNEHFLFMSNGTSEIKVLDPYNYQTVRRIKVQARGVPVTKLNELEWVNGEIFANIWFSEKIARIHPETGEVVGWIDLTGLNNNRSGQDDVLNGIAYDGQNRLFVTGKLWSNLFEVKLVLRD